MTSKSNKKNSKKPSPKKLTKSKLKKIKGGVQSTNSYPMCPAPAPTAPNSPGTT